MVFSVRGFSLFSMIFSMTLLGWLMRLLLGSFLHRCRLLFLGIVMTKDWVHSVGHSPVCQILSQIVVRAVITSSPPASTSSAGMLSTPADFPFFSDCTAASTSLRRIGRSSSVCLGTVQYWWISIGLVIVQLSAVLCPSVQYLLYFCEAFPELSWAVIDFTCFTVVKISRVGMPSYCCYFSDFLQSHYTVLLSSFCFAFFMHLLLLFTSLYF